MSTVSISSLLLCVEKNTKISLENKELLKSKIKKLAHQLLSSHFFEVIAVLGLEIEALEAELKHLPVKLVHNEFYIERGLHSAIKAGIMNLNLNCDYFAICLADQQSLTKKDYNKLILAAKILKDSTEALIICPTYQNKPGSPILISSSLIPEILDHPDADHDCSYLIERYPDQILFIEMDNAAFISEMSSSDYF